MKQIAFAILLSLAAHPALAGEADVVDVRYTQSSDGSYTFHVTVRHQDEGWGHYADRWQVIGPGGTVLGERVLAHPHENEQPFTRSQSGIVIPDDLEAVTVRARDSAHGWGGIEMTVPVKGRF